LFHPSGDSDPGRLAIYERIIAAWNARDAAAFAVEFLDNGHVVGFDGSQLEGADAIASTVAGIFQAARHTPVYLDCPGTD